MNKEEIDVHSRDGLIAAEEFVNVLNELGASTAGKLYTKLGELRKKRAGSYESPEEAIDAVVTFLDSALQEIVASIAAVEVAAKSDGEPRHFTLNFVED